MGVDAAEKVGIYSSLEEVYGPSVGPEIRARFAAVAAAFGSGAPILYARSPGRVNLIGEHIDYEGYSVLPMAIGLDCIVGIREVEGGSLSVSNTDPAFKTRTFADPCGAAGPNGEWTDYVCAGYRGVVDHLRTKSLPSAGLELGGLELVVDGVVPAGGGLSSSSALVCAVAIAIMAVRGLSFGKGEVAELACLCERYSGTQSGGMDQAISVMGQAGVAKLVDFGPVRTTDVVLPPGVSFLIGNSLAVSKKAEGAHTRYNLRVVECRLAAAVLGFKTGVFAPAEALALETLKEVEVRLGSRAAAQRAASTCLHEGVYLSDELEELFGAQLESIFSGEAASVAVLRHNADVGFRLRDRAAHVYAEAERVLSFQVACAAGSSAAVLADLMDASHASCRDLYDCSCAELEELVAAFKNAGALGARLTGAGWGGCAVAIVPTDEASGVLKSVRETFYKPRVETGAVRAEDVSKALFVTLPSAGAAIFKDLKI
mmetsp:Transcript_49165/g.96094  ORF Transcript_49165/g.96094 Transcript_49165/m.96094 type:complete len:487 (-) Transcript_49165:158-1618(-)